MFIKYTDPHPKGKIRIKERMLFKCDNCGSEYERPKSVHLKCLDRYEKDLCKKCCIQINNNTLEYKENMSKAISKIAKTKEWRKKNSESKKGIINLGNKNGMKDPKVAKRMGETKKKRRALDPENYTKNISIATRKAWADGKYDGVKVGQCKWYDYHHSNGSTYKVQGTWELKFIEWLDNTGLEFDCHRGRLKYQLNGETRSYYPDFFVHDWNCYAEIKSDYYYELQKNKIEAIFESNPDVEIRILMKKELTELGIKL